MQQYTSTRGTIVVFLLEDKVSIARAYHGILFSFFSFWHGMEAYDISGCMV